jgi:hypothetical protein
VLVLHDTSEFDYRNEENEAIGMVSKQRTRSTGRPRYHTMRGVLMHSSLVVTQQGLPLGLAANQVLDPGQVPRRERAEAHDQPNARAEPAEGELSLAGEREAAGLRELAEG